MKGASQGKTSSMPAARSISLTASPRSTRQRVDPAPGRSSPAPQPAQSHRPADMLLSLKLSPSHSMC